MIFLVLVFLPRISIMCVREQGDIDMSLMMMMMMIILWWFLADSE